MAETHMRLGLSITDLVNAQDPDWIRDVLPLKTEDTDALEIDKLLMQGLSPDQAAHEFSQRGVPVRQLYGLKYLARERENKIMEVIGDPISELVERVREGDRVRVHMRRMRRLVAALEREGIETEVVYIVRRAD
jgi:hypothetical protein